MPLQEADPAIELWDGKMIGTAGALAQFGADRAEAFGVARLAEVLGSLEVTELFFDPAVDPRVAAAVEQTGAGLPRRGGPFR